MPWKGWRGWISRPIPMCISPGHSGQGGEVSKTMMTWSSYTALRYTADRLCLMSLPAGPSRHASANRCTRRSITPSDVSGRDWTGLENGKADGWSFPLSLSSCFSLSLSFSVWPSSFLHTFLSLFAWLPAQPALFRRRPQPHREQRDLPGGGAKLGSAGLPACLPTPRAKGIGP